LRPTPPAKCELCGAVDELRPYGPNGERVCFDCGIKDEAALDRGFKKYILAETNPLRPVIRIIKLAAKKQEN
jgi:hypothetical protein